MSRFVLLSLCLSLSSASWARAEDAPPKPTSEEQWLRGLRGSTSYREGMANVRRLVEAAYDEGAIAGASHWDDLREYYISLGREKGCKQGLPYAQGPTKACHRAVGAPPGITGRIYEERAAKVAKLADETSHPETVRRVLVVLFDYGYVQGLKHGLRSNEDEIRWRQAYYRSCMTRANDAAGETTCANGSKEWATGALDEIEKQINTHGLTAGQSSK